MVTSHPPRRYRHAFTLLELIVVVIIIAVLAAIASFGVNQYLTRARDTAAQASLLQIEKKVTADTMAHDIALTLDAFTTAAAASQAAVAVQLPDGTSSQTLADAAAITLTTPGAPALQPGQLSVAISPDWHSAGLALMASTHSCIYGAIDNGGPSARVAEGDQGANCVGYKGNPNLAPTPVPVPTNVTAASGTTAWVSWDPIAVASSYAVYVDGSATPIWTGTTPNADITGLANGDHTVTVTGSSADGGISDPSAPVTVHIWPLNSTSAAAWVIDPMAPDQSSVTGDSNTNPSGSGWFIFTAPGDQTYTFKQLAPNVGPALSGYESVTVYPDAAGAPDTANPVATVNAGTLKWAGTSGTKYWIKLSTISNGVRGAFRAQVTRGAVNDDFVNALTAQMPNEMATWVSDNVTSANSGTEAGEYSPTNNDLWWKFTPTQETTYNLQVIAPLSPYTGTARSGYVQIDVFDNPTSASSPTAAYATTQSASLNFHGVPGNTYYIRVGSISNGTPGAYRIQLTSSAFNDYFTSAMALNVPASGATTYTKDVNSQYASTESGEPNSNHTLWFTFTAPATTTFTAKIATVADTTLSPKISGYSHVCVYTGNTTAADGTGGCTNTINATAGTTYYIQAGSFSNGTPGWFRLSLARS
ncbi:MAG TPA: prepilin-type N-terminal cleavage/methylation domain-containing protein [Marmoricola sp.]